jgi:hypothetical protein
MDHSTALKIAHYKLIHGGPLSIEELADAVCRSQNYLYRLANLAENIPFPSNLEDKFMELQNNYEPLKIKASRLGFAMIKLPKIKMARGDENEMVASYSAATSEAVNNFTKFLKNPGEVYPKLRDSLDKVINESVAVKKFADKKISKQIDLEL